MERPSPERVRRVEAALERRHAGIWEAALSNWMYDENWEQLRHLVQMPLEDQDMVALYDFTATGARAAGHPVPSYEEMLKPAPFKA